MSINFPNHLDARHLGNNQWKLNKSFEYHSKKYGITKVPVGFVSDGASFPRIVYSIMGSPWGGKCGKPSVIHDYDYFKQINRKIADRKFLEGLKVEKVFFIKRDIMYRMLRMFGWIAWRKKRK